MSDLLGKYTKYAIRANDIYPTISRAIHPELGTSLHRTLDVGALCNLTKILKNLRGVITQEQFTYLASNIGVDRYASSHYLRELQEIEFINVAAGRIENSIPATSLTIFESIGQRLESYSPSELEIQHFELMNNVAEMPSKVVDLFEKLDVKPENMKLFKNIGYGCGYLDSYVSPADAKEILYSPIYWEENPSKLFELIDKFQHDRVLEKISHIRNHQGLPVIDVGEDDLLTEAVASGALPTNSVTSTGGEQFFIFTPNLGVKIYEKDIMKKARQIVASVRYGENFAQITRIVSAKRVLEALLRRGQIGGHTENIHQYGMLIEMGLVYPRKAYYGHSIHLNDTIENRRTFQIAIELLESGTIIDNEAMIAEEDLEKTFKKGKAFSDELININKFKQKIPAESDTLQKIADYLRGVDEDVFK
ncbi:hypothetical protein CON66_16650 [Bacillus cereus]|uniref:hypothetical protein n=1 Tax=Bacillus TaxID=1386 RepID=UPI000BEE42A4|nr:MULTISPECIES: hypothetical protein [Bacillus cereus group]PEA95306.1 hypothetical protein CON66_16650 [Bacillus cereus]PFN06392.1 hypothetical protein COJ51_12070 [Bacillus thuringiensis]PGN49631.1 hypothetical protein CN962_07825 [Bacillus cereus]